MHSPVMVGEVMDALLLRPGGVYLDGTLGDGGHAEALLERLNGECVLIGIDRDREALKCASERLSRWRDKRRLAHGNFSEMRGIAAGFDYTAVDGVILDLGVSSRQLDTAERGFSFQREGPLDMRMDRTAAQSSAFDMISGADELTLRDWLWSLGGERGAGRVARAIVRARDAGELRSTLDLAETVARALGNRRRIGRIHPATRTFQALRIIVNDELDNLSRGLESSIQLLRPGGRLAVISYHSLEDGLVKRIMRGHMQRYESLPAGGRRCVGTAPFVRAVTRKPLNPSDFELKTNRRARSAKLRVMEICRSEQGG